MRVRQQRVPVGDRGPGHSHRPDLSPPTIFGAHQPGIATPKLPQLAFAALDVARDADLPALLARGSAAAEEAMADGGATVTLGLGPGLFDARFGLAAARPLGLRELPPFPGDALDPAWCGGDLCVQACGPSAAAARAALECVAGALGEAAAVRWQQTGEGPRRGPLGFREGANNLRRGIDLDRHVWVRARERSWMLGGSFLVVRRIRIDLEAWARLSVAEQEAVMGRHKESGVPVGGGPPERLPAGSHVRVAAPRENARVAILRRGYDYDAGGSDAGLLFLAFMADPRRQYVPLQRRLAGHDALSAFTVHTGSAVFAVPPGARPGGFLGEELVEAARPAPSGSA
jgi:deferrochelatase/peroxidase EfeB